MIDQKHNKLIGLTHIVFLICCLFYSVHALAAPPSGSSPPINVSCDIVTDYQVANLNEIKSKGGGVASTVEFVEIKILANNTNVAGWEICFSDNPTKESCTAIGVGNGTWYTTTQTTGLPDNASTHPMGTTYYDANTWITYVATNVKADEGEVILRSSSGDSGLVLDYIRYSGMDVCGDGLERWNLTHDGTGGSLDVLGLVSEPDDFTVCSACFGARDPSQKDFARSDPDGSGDWGNNGDAPSEGSTNDTSGGTAGSFNITIFSPGSTCSTDGQIGGAPLRERVIIEVLNNGGNTLTNFNGIVNLTTSNNHGNWYTTDGTGASADPALGILSDTAGDDNGAASYDFDPNDNGFVSLYFDNQHAETMTITVTLDGDPGTFAFSAPLQFLDNVFVVNVSEPNPPFNTTPNDLVPIAGRPHQFQIQMMRRDTSLTPNDCGPASNYNIPSIKAWYTPGPEHPVGATAPSLNATSITTAEPVAANFPASFASGVATFNLNTTDVGKFALVFKDDFSGFADVDIDSDPINLTVRPFGFDIDTSDQRQNDYSVDGLLDGDLLVDGDDGNATYAADENGSVFARAGEDFTVTVTAVRWQSGDDVGDDGVPDTGANLTDNLPTNSYGQELITPATVDITHAVTLPTPTPDTGSLSGGLAITGFTNGAADVTLSFDEVGILEFSADDTSYLTTGVGITGIAPNYGRFVPYVFETSLNIPEFNPACGIFGYIGQPFTYATAPVITLTARAKETPPGFNTKTDNYTGNFFKLTDAKLLADGNLSYSSFLGTLDLGNVMLLLADPVIADNGDGTATLTFSDGGGIAFNRGNPEDPFAADIALSIDIFDEDDVFAGDINGVSINPVSFGTASAGNGIDFTDADLDLMDNEKEQRWGRLILDNAFGSELLPLEVSVRAEYQSNGDFITSTDDGCTAYNSAAITFSNHSGITAGANLTASGAGTLINGADDDANPLILSNTLPETGFVDATHNIDFWLKYDWDGIDNPPTPDGDLYDDDPTSRATWGIFAGPDEFIYIREPW